MVRTPNADIRPVVWLKRRQQKPGKLFRAGVKPSAVRSVKLNTSEALDVCAAILYQEARNAQLKALAAARKGC